MKEGGKSCENKLDMILKIMANYSNPWSTVNTVNSGLSPLIW